MQYRLSYVKGALTIASSQLVTDVCNLTHWDPMNNRIQCGFRDAAYFIIDFPRFVTYSYSNYGAVRRYMRQARLNKGKINPEDFRNIDTNALRSGLAQQEMLVRGPLSKVDMRVFFYIYFVMMAYCTIEFYKLNKMKNEREDKSDSSLIQRSEMFDDDYIEDLREK